MTFSEILAIEDNNTDKIYLWREGMFLKAYEHSAFLCYRHVHEFKLSRRFIKTVNRHVVSLGFPESALKKWMWAFPVHELAEKQLVCELEKTVDEVDYQQWLELASVIANPGDRYTVHTSVIEKSPVWKVAYDLLGQVFDFSPNLSKNVREPLGNCLKQLVYEICDQIREVYDVADRASYIKEIQGKCRKVMFSLQILRDRREISADKAFPLAAERIDSVSRQLEGLRRKATAEVNGAGLNQQPTASLFTGEQ